MTALEGVDVANWQGEIDWPTVAASGVRFAWCKATEGLTFNDPFYAVNVLRARAAGIPVGAYHFAIVTRSGPELQAQHFRAYVGHLDLPAVLDAEGPWLPSRAANTDWVLRWFDSVNEAHSVLYTNGAGTARLDLHRLDGEGVELFYARPGALDFAGVGPLSPASVVQYGQRPVPGIVGLVDADMMQAATLARYLGTQPPPLEDDEMVKLHYAQLEDDPRVWLVSTTTPPRHVILFDDVDWWAGIEGVQATESGATIELGPDAAGETRRGIVIDADDHRARALFGFEPE